MDNTLINRINELAEKSYSENRFVFTDFLDMSQLSSFYSLERDLAYVGTSVSGGTEGCERCMVRFGTPESLGYDEAFPIVLLHISPVQKKFSDALTHRDFLGSVIGLGIERTKLGDIIVRDNEGYIFVSESISEYILENLSKVKHTNVRVEKIKKVSHFEFSDGIYLTKKGRNNREWADRISKQRAELILDFIKQTKTY